MLNALLRASFTSACLAVALMHPAIHAGAAEQAGVRVPHNAFDRTDRRDLASALAAQGRLRVIVGLQTPLEISRPLDASPDPVRREAVLSRQERVLQRLAAHDVRNVRRLRYHHFMAVTLDAAGLSAMLADPEVTSVAEDRPNYPVLHDTPAITRAEQAWIQGQRGGGQAVAVIDTGVDAGHPFLTGKVIAEACFSQPVGANATYCPGGTSPRFGAGSAAPCPDGTLGCWHGTHVAGIAAGRLGVLSATTGGIAPEANIIAIQVFQRECTGGSCDVVAYDSDILAALDHVYSLRNTHSIGAVNVSLGGDLYPSQCDASLPAYRTIITNLRHANIPTVVAAGNNGSTNAISAPACISDAISVGSTSKQNAVSSFSNSASFLSLLAPGGGITSSVPASFIAGGFATSSGTSLATPHVSGAFALIRGARPNASVTEIVTALQGTGFPVTDTRNGVVKRLIQVADALGALGGIPPAVSLSVSPETIAPGGTVTATWSNIVSPSAWDWIGLYRAGASDTNYVTWVYVSCTKTAGAARANGSCAFGVPAGLATGPYELRLFSAGGFSRVATSGPLNVSSAPAPTTLNVSPTSVSPGGTVTASWSNIASPSAWDWIGLYRAGASDTNYVTWVYVSCTKSAGTARANGDCAFAIPAGLATGGYELRLFSNGAFTRIATSQPLSVGTALPPTTLSVSPGSVAAGGTVTATWNNIAFPNAWDWIGLYRTGAADTVYVTWVYVSCSKTVGSAQASGSCPLVIPPGLATGSYELRLFSSGGFTRIATSGALTIAVSGASLAGDSGIGGRVPSADQRR